MKGYLEMQDGAFIGVRDGLTLGRVAACDIVIDDTKASRRHARLIVESGVVEIEDLQSSNGTLLNGKPVTRRMLREGDEVRIGKTALVYHEGALPGAQASRSPAGGGAAAVFDDDDDLLGGGDDDDLLAGPDTSDSPPAPTAAASLPLTPPKPAEPPQPVEPPKPPKPVEPTPPPSDAATVEFEDEVVQVRRDPPKPKPEARPAPAPAPKPKPRAEPVVERRAPSSGSAGAAGRSASRASSDDEPVASSQRVLQFSKNASSGGGLLGDDMGQMSSGMRTLIVLAAIAVGAAIVWGIMTAMQ